MGGGTLLFLLASRPGGIASIFPGGFFHPATAPVQPTTGSIFTQSALAVIPGVFQDLSRVIGNLFQVPTEPAVGVTIPDVLRDIAPIEAITPDMAGWTVVDLFGGATGT